jgi:two-component system response regulator QseB
MRLLIVEDDTMIGAAVCSGLKQEGYNVDWVRDGKSALAALSTAPYALALLDLGLPDKDGFTILGDLRREKSPVPVIILTARDPVPDRVRGLDLGADDYLLKPFDLDELSARIRAVMRRRSGRAEGVMEYDTLRLDPATHEVSLDGRPVDLSAREFAVLEALLERPSAVLSRAQLEERLYSWDKEVASNAIEVHIHNLRKKLGGERIRTIRGIGYSVARSH